MDSRRLALGALLVMVLGFAGAGLLVLRNELVDDSAERVPSAWEVAWNFLAAVDDRKPGTAAKLTSDPVAAEQTLSTVFAKLPDTKLSTLLGEVKTDGSTASGPFDVRWKLDDTRSWKYRNTVKLTQGDDGRWSVDWTPALVHPDLKPGEHVAVVSNAKAPAVLDSEGKPFLRWNQAGPRPVNADRARLVQPSMIQLAGKRGEPEDWAVAALNSRGERMRVLPGEGPRQAAPLRTTLNITAQDAAQEAVDSVRRPAALVAIRPSTGGIVAIAQNEAAANGPIALSGLFPPGSTFKIVTAAAAMQNESLTAQSPVRCPGSANFGSRTLTNDRKFDLGEVPLKTAFARSCNTTFGFLAEELGSRDLVKSADQLGLNADFDIPGLSTEAGAVRPSKHAEQRVEDAIGQGQIHASPFGVALMSATVASGKQVIPKLWFDRDTKVLASYPPPDAAIINELRTMMRETVTTGTATALRGLGEVYGKTGTAQAGGDIEHGWFTGYRGDLAFAVFVDDGGSSKPAVRITAKFLGGL